MVVSRKVKEQRQVEAEAGCLRVVPVQSLWVLGADQLAEERPWVPDLGLLLDVLEDMTI